MLKNSICRLSTQRLAAGQASQTLLFFPHNTNLGGIIIAAIPILRPGPGLISIKWSSFEHNSSVRRQDRSSPILGSETVSLSDCLETSLVKLTGNCSAWQEAGRAASSTYAPPRLVVQIDIQHGAREVIMEQQGCSDLIRHRYHCRPSGLLGVQHLWDRLFEAEQCWRSAVQGSYP